MHAYPNAARRSVLTVMFAVGVVVAATSSCGGDADAGAAPGVAATGKPDDRTPTVATDGGGPDVATRPPTSTCPDGKALTVSGEAETTTSYTKFIAEKPYELTRVANVTFSHHGGFTLQGDWILPKTPNAAPAPGILVMVHGGGWNDCDNRRKSSEPIAELWAAATGVGVFNVEYRLIGEGGAYPENLRDVRCALRWARKDAARLGLDGGRMVLMGDSAGAHLVSEASLTLSRDDLDDATCGDAPPNVVGTIAFSGVYDLPLFASAAAFPNPNVGNSTAMSPSQLVTDYTGACTSPIGACLTAASPTPCIDASPVAHACSAVAPFLLVHAPDGLDPLVPLEQATALRDALTEAKKDVTLIVPTREQMEAFNTKEAKVCTPELSHGYSPCLVFPTIDPVAAFLVSKLR